MKNGKYVTYAIRTSEGAFGCRLTADDKFHFTFGAPCPYGAETVAYAVCRYIRRCPALRDPLIREAVKLGLTVRGKPKGRTRRVRTRASALELPGKLAHIKLLIQPGKIVVKDGTIEPGKAKSSDSV